VNLSIHTAPDGRPQPALDVKQHPSAVRMLADRLEQRVRIKQRLQISADDFLSNAVGDRWNARRPDATTCFGMSTRRTGGGK